MAKRKIIGNVVLWYGQWTEEILTGVGFHGLRKLVGLFSNRSGEIWWELKTKFVNQNISRATSQFHWKKSTPTLV